MLKTWLVYPQKEAKPLLLVAILDDSTKIEQSLHKKYSKTSNYVLSFRLDYATQAPIRYFLNVYCSCF